MRNALRTNKVMTSTDTSKNGNDRLKGNEDDGIGDMNENRNR
jgi:hypothetical protein